MSIMESQSFKKRGTELKLIIDFNENDEREYFEILEEIEDVITDILDKRGHTLLSGHSKGLTAKDLE